MDISILLPYKENFSPNYAGAVSLFVNDITRKSKYKNNTNIFGNTDYIKKLSSNYINLKLEKKFYTSSSKVYVESFIEAEKKYKSKIIEIHNRPNYIKYLIKNHTTKFVLFFHNDPLSMNGSKTIKDRLYLIENLDTIFFNSNWSKKRFFIGIKSNDIIKTKTFVCYQSAPKTKINFKKKEKLISFIGKLNVSKGYDIFGLAVCKILSKYKDWKAIVIGDEPRENLLYKHKNLKILGFKNNDYILEKLKKVSISVVSSRWDEPFGRASLEASSRGSAVIISNKGGLPETSKHALILNSLSVNNLFKIIDDLIKNKKKLIKIQKKIFSSFILTHEYVANIIDNVRSDILIKDSQNKFKTTNSLPIKILHITNFNYRFYGRLHYNTGRRINNGFIRLGHNVLSISDRDIINANKGLTDLTGHNYLQKYIINTYQNFKPDIVVLGHADNVNSETLNFMKKDNNYLKISQWFLDPLGKIGPDHIKNKNRILNRNDLIDINFLTTDPKSLNFKIKNSFFIPNPCDQSFESLHNYREEKQNDVFFAMSHGVHRGQLKDGKNDQRENFINRLMENNKDLTFDIYGMKNIQPIWGNDFISNIAKSSMGLNLSRGDPIKYYSSDRIVQLIGNGLLTFIHKDTQYGNFFTNNEMVFYKDLSDLGYKLNKYKHDKSERKRIAKNGKKFYFKHFNSTIIARYIVDKTLNRNKKIKYLWENRK